MSLIEDISTRFNEFEFHRYMVGLKKFSDRNCDQPIALEALPEPTGVPKEILWDFLKTSLLNQGVGSKEVAKLEDVYHFAHHKFESTPGRERRLTGDETITHSLWMASLLAENGITDMDVQMATILHDVHEDTETSLEEIQRISSSDTAELDDSLTKVKTTRLLEKDKRNHKLELTQRQKEEDEKKTLLKLLNALETDPRAFIIKAADVIHNQATSDTLPFETRIAKANLALNFYEPMLRGLGFTKFAEMIGDYSLRSVRRKDYEEILAKKEEFDATISPFYQRLIEGIAEQGFYGNKQLCLHYVGLESPSVYKIYQESKGRETQTQHFLPTIHIVCDNEEELFRWHRYFYSQGATSEIPDLDAVLSSGQSLIETSNFELDGKIFELKVKLSRKDMLIQPAHLFIDAINLTHQEETIAGAKLWSIANSYKQAILAEKSGEANVPQEVTEAVTRGLINVYDRDGNIQSIPVGSTALDFAYRIGANLGNDAINVKIFKKSGDEWSELKGATLGTPLKEGVRVVIETKKSQTITPDRYDLITTEKARLDIKRKINRQIKIWVGNKGVYENLDQERIAPGISSLVVDTYPDKTGRKQQFIDSVRQRGVKIISKMYEIRRGKKLDSHIIDVFDERLASKFGSLDDMLVNIGLTPIPFKTEGAYGEKWLSDRIDIPDSVKYTRFIADKLIAFRRSRPVIVASFLEDRPGILKNIGLITEELGVDVQIRSRIDNTSPGRKTVVELVFMKGGQDQLYQFMHRLMQEYNDLVVIDIVRSKERKSVNQ